MADREHLGDQPSGTPATIVMPMPRDTNQSGDIFGGWLMAQMDIAGSVAVRPYAGGRTVTVAVEAMVFHQPVLVGDVVTFYGEILRTGNTSVTVRVDAWAQRRSGVKERVTSGTLTYVRVDDNRMPVAIAKKL